MTFTLIESVSPNQKKSSAMRESIRKKYEDIQRVLDEDLGMTLTHLEMEERAAVTALEDLMEKNCTIIQEIEQDLARLTTELAQKDIILPDTMVIWLFSSIQHKLI